MKVTVEMTYDMSKALGMDSFELENVHTVEDVVRASKQKVGPEFEKLARVAAVVINGVMVNHRKGMKSPVADGDRVSFVKAAAGG